MKLTGNRLFLVLIGLILLAALTISASLRAIAQAPAAAPPTNTGGSAGGQKDSAAALGKAILQQGILSVESRRSIAAEILVEADVFDKTMKGVGEYQEQQSERGPQLHLELKIEMPGRAANVWQICDGRYLWASECFGGGRTLSRIDVVRVFQILNERGEFPQPGIIDRWPGLGGLSKLLRSLAASFDFVVLDDIKLDAQVQSYRLVGQWRLDKLVQLVPEQKGAIESGKPPNLSKLPKHLPHSVMLYLGKDDLFPYRLEYRRQESGRSDTADRNLVVVKFHHVKVNVPIDPARFVFDPEKQEYSEQTDHFLDSLGIKKK